MLSNLSMIIIMIAICVAALSAVEVSRREYGKATWLGLMSLIATVFASATLIADTILSVASV